MAKTEDESFIITRLGPNGRLTIPKAYRRALTTSEDTVLMVLPVGDALVIVPCDAALTSITHRLQEKMQNAGSNVEDLIAAAEEARAEILREEFGEPDEG